MQKILVVASTFPAANTDPVPAFVKDQVIALKKFRPVLEISVLAPHDLRSQTKSFTSHEHYDEYRFHYFWPHKAEKLAGRGIMPALKTNKLNYFLVPFLFAGEFFALLKLAKKLKPDVIYAHWFTPQAINAMLVSKLTKVPFVYTTHAADVDVWHKIPILGKYIVRAVTRSSKGVTAVSKRSMEKLKAFFTSPELDELEHKLVILPMGVNLPKSGLQKPRDKIIKNITFIGRLAEKKGVQFLLPAYANIKKQYPDTRLIVAGDGPWQSRLKIQAKELNISDSVTFPGYVTGSHKEDLLTASDIYVIPSIITDDGDAEGLPVSLMEGLAYGKVCIATNESGADGILKNGKDGYLVDQKDSLQLEEALKSTLELSDAEYATISSNAVSTAQQFSWDSIATKHYHFFEGKLNEKI